MSEQSKLKRRLKALMNRPENLICADCTEKQPRWASLIKVPGAPPGTPAIGAFMCLECSGSHRRLGVHIAFVRSVNLDSWKETEVRSMENGGNRKVNAIFEANLARSGVRKPTNTANGQARERYIRDKYERRKFYDPAAWGHLAAEESSSSSSEDESPVRSARRTVKTPVTRVPSEAAQRRAASRQSRSAAPAAPTRTSSKKAAAASAADLLDLSAPAPAAPQAQQASETLDLFANMSVSDGPQAPAQPKQKNNADIMALFNTPAAATNPMMTTTTMPNPQMNSAMMMQQPAQMNQQQQQQMMMQQQMMQQQMMQQQQMMRMQQQQPNGSGMMPNQMMMQPGSGMPGIHPSQQSMMGSMQPSNIPIQRQQPPRPESATGFGGATMGSGPPVSSFQQQQQAPQQQQQPDDPFAQFGTNVFRS